MPEAQESGADAPTLVQLLDRDLAAWRPRSQGQALLRDEYRVFLGTRGASAIDRDSEAQHLTASCFVFSPDRSEILLCFHRKGRFWVQLGGHIDASDASSSAAAFREAFEESGIAVEAVSEQLVDVDRHALSSGFGRCSVHWDLGFAATAPEGSVPVVSDESDDVRWWPAFDLPAAVPPGFDLRVSRILDALPALR